MLTDRYLDGVPGGFAGGARRVARAESADRRRASPHIRALNEIARGRGQTLAQLAMAWALRDDRVTSVLVGASSVEQLEANLAAVENLAFDDDELARIDEHAVDTGTSTCGAASSAVGADD